MTLVGCGVMQSITCIVSGTCAEQERDAVRHLADAYQTRGYEVALVAGLTPWALLRLLFMTDTDVVDFHGARVSVMCWATRLLKRRCVTVSTLHEREEFREGQSFFTRMLIRFGTWVAVRTAHEVIVTQKVLQYVLFRQFGRLPMYIPHGVVAPARPRTSRLPHRLERRRFVIVFSRVLRPAQVASLQRTLKTLAWPSRLVQILPPSASAGARATGRVRILPWSAAAHDALLFSTHTILVLEPTRFPAWIRHLTTYGRPIIALDTPEHREALPFGAVFLPGTSAGHLRETLRHAASQTATLVRGAHRLAANTSRLYRWEHIAQEYLKTYQRAELEPAFVDSLTPRVRTTHP